MRRLLGSVLLLLAFAASPALAAWPHDPYNGGVPFYAQGSNQFASRGIADGAGGMIVTWMDLRAAGNYHIFAQHISAAGVPLWTTDGVFLGLAGTSQQYNPVLVSDGAGGAIIAWDDTRNGTEDVYVQRLNGAGVAQWTANGVGICKQPGIQSVPVITSDGAGGAVIAWLDARTATTRIFAQRVNGAGVAQWTTDGVALSAAASIFYQPVITTDGAGGAFIAWMDPRNAASNLDVFMTRVTASGATAGPFDGVTVCNAASAQYVGALVPDGWGGVIAVWYDYRNGAADIYAQHVSAAMGIMWAGNGVAVCTAVLDQTYPTATADGFGGVLIAWNDARNSSSDTYVQRLTGSGTAVWAANGIKPYTSAYYHNTSAILSDGVGGAIVAWDQTVGTSDVQAQHVSASGASLWGADGTPISLAAGYQQYPAMVSDGNNGAIVWFTDSRRGTLDLFAQRIDRYGLLGSTEPTIASIKDVPNDQGGKLKLSWNPSWLDTESNAAFGYYGIFRSVPGSVANAAIRAGATQLSDFSRAPAAGTRAFVVNPTQANAFAWEYMINQYPNHLGIPYAYLSPTTGDSTGAYNPRTAFMVVAYDPTGVRTWMSAPDSGYSVDNIPPTVPAPLLGQYSAGQAKLHWNPVTAPDLAGYNLYRGNNPTFVPSAATLLTTRPDTGYVDNAGTAYVYKLSAVDVHGNESPVTTWYPANALAVGDDAGAALAFAAPSPNPARGSTTLRYVLPAGGRVRLSVFDASGRRVRMLADAAQNAGAHEAAFELRDDQGHALPPGLYLARLEAAGRVITRRIAAVR